MCCGFETVSHTVQEQTGISFSSVFSGFFVPVIRPALCSVSLSGDNCEFLFGVATTTTRKKKIRKQIIGFFCFIFQIKFFGNKVRVAALWTHKLFSAKQKM